MQFQDVSLNFTKVRPTRYFSKHSKFHKILNRRSFLWKSSRIEVRDSYTGVPNFNSISQDFVETKTYSPTHSETEKHCSRSMFLSTLFNIINWPTQFFDPLILAGLAIWSTPTTRLQNICVRNEMKKQKKKQEEWNGKHYGKNKIGMCESFWITRIRILLELKATNGRFRHL